MSACLSWATETSDVMADEMFMAPPSASIGITICAPVMSLENTRFETW